ncbi:hypothetical protein [Nesterenkonia sp. CF4.4]|uniref:hypothetical protein n=1 Tax=Nesterenkonia sp. CF4.4 TaxID=3373079 RepID=UPI003EE7353D
MSSTPEENRTPEQPRWGQRRPEGSTPNQQPGQGAPQDQPSGYGRSAGYGESAGYGQPPSTGQHSGSHQSYGSGQGDGQQPGQVQHGGGQVGYGAPQGQLQPGYGQPGYGQGSYGQGGYGPGAAPAQKPKRPMTLILAMVLMLLAGAAALTLSILSFSSFASVDPQDVDPFWTEVAAESQAQQPPGAEELSVQELMLGLGVLVLLGGIILASLYAMFAFVGTMTGNVGRILATIFLAGSVFMIFFGAENLIVTGLSLAAIVALWLPASNTYVRDRKAWKEFARTGNPYGSAASQGPGQPGPQNPQGWAPQQQNPYQQGPHQQGPYQQGQSGHAGQTGPGQQNPSQRDNPYGGSSPR